VVDAQRRALSPAAGSSSRIGISEGDWRIELRCEREARRSFDEAPAWFEAEETGEERFCEVEA